MYGRGGHQERWGSRGRRVPLRSLGSDVGSCRLVEASPRQGGVVGAVEVAALETRHEPLVPRSNVSEEGPLGPSAEGIVVDCPKPVVRSPRSEIILGNGSLSVCLLHPLLEVVRVFTL